MTRAKRTTQIADSLTIAESTSKKVLSFLNAAQTAEEIAGAVEIKGDRDVGIKVAESLLDRRARLGGFSSLNQVAATPQVGDVRFAQIVTALDARKDSLASYVIEGTVETAERVAKLGLTVHAIVNGVDVGSASVDTQGKYRLSFQHAEEPANAELRVLPSGIPVRASESLALAKKVSFARYAASRQGYRADVSIKVPAPYLELWHRVTKTYNMHGVVYATTFAGGFPISLEPLPAAKIEFYEVDAPLLWLYGTEPSLSEAYLGYAYTGPDGSYDFNFSFSYTTGIYWTWYWLFTDTVPDIKARISQFVDGAWTQVYEGPVDWDIVEDFHRDYFIPREDVIPVPPGGVKPAEGFRFVSLGLLPIDSTRIQLGYATSHPGDPVAGISHQPFCSTLRVFGLFAESPPIASYKVQVATADEDSVIGAWQDVADPLHNSRWNDTTHVWDNMVLGPDPVTGRYQNIDTQPEADWHEHALKFTWNSANVVNGYYALRVIGYDASATQVGTFQMPILRIDNSVPEVSLEVVGTSVGAVTRCGVIQLGYDSRIQFRVTAADPEGHVKRYWLSGTRGKVAVTAGATIQETRPSLTAGWVGRTNYLVEFTVAPLPLDLLGCPAVAYNFELHVRGLSTDGYSSEPVAQWDRRESNLVVTGP